MSRTRWRVAAAVLVVAGLAPAAAGASTGSAGQTGRPITVAAIGGEASFRPFQVNERGQVAGIVHRPGMRGPWEAALWDGGRLTSVSPPLSPDGYSRPAALNERGDVVGTASVAGEPLGDRPFLWSGGRLVDLGVDASTEAEDVNDRGQVLLSHLATTGPVASVWTAGEVVEPPLVDGLRSSYAGINNRGEAAGSLLHFSPEGFFDIERTEPATWRVGRDVQRLPAPGGSGNTWATAINDAGVVVGVVEGRNREPHRVVVWRRGGGPRDVGTLGGERTQLWFGEFNYDENFLSPRGHVVGFSETASGDEHAFLWCRGEMLDLGTLGGAESFATAVNSHGQVVGYSETAAGESHAFLWQDGRMVDLGELAGTANSTATDINDRGQVVGYAQGSGMSTQGLMWTAPPPPRRGRC